ncbi:MAG: hypothetical protein AAGJ35_02190 [Myxococcota bacterium]
MYLPATRWAERFFFWLAIFAACFALFMHWGIHQTRIPRQTWSKAAHYIQQHQQPGDVVALLPVWALMGTERIRLPILHAEFPGREDLSRYRRLWVLHAPHLGKWWFQRSFSRELQDIANKYWRKQIKSFGHVELSLFVLPPAPKTLYRLDQPQFLQQAEVGYETPSKHMPIRGCRATSSTGSIDWLPKHAWRSKTLRHRGPRGLFFGPILQEINNTPRRCLWAVPRACRRLHILYKHVPLRGQLHFAHGFGTATPRSALAPTLPPSGPDVEASIFVENQWLTTLRAKHTFQWQKHTVPLHPKHWKRKTGSLHIILQIAGKPQVDRPGYCFQASVRERL